MSPWVIAAVVMFASTAQAEQSGLELFERCISPAYENQLNCRSYLAGAFESFALQAGCQPLQRIEAGQLELLFVDWARTHDLQGPRALTVRMALEAARLCPAQGP